MLSLSCYRLIHLIGILVCMSKISIAEEGGGPKIVFHNAAHLVVFEGTDATAAVREAILFDLENALTHAKETEKPLRLIEESGGFLVKIGNSSIWQFIDKSLVGMECPYDAKRREVAVSTEVVDRYQQTIGRIENLPAMIHDARKLRSALISFVWDDIYSRRFIHSTATNLSDAELVARWKHKWAGIQPRIKSLLEISGISELSKGEKLIGSGLHDFHKGDLVWQIRLFKGRDGGRESWLQPLLWRDQHWKFVMLVPGGRSARQR